ncbi:MAG: hypothetical protein U9Q73_01305 [Nanoarchaeota archaeon]|nr:hypothetical protein [Nanoarchaeota archaeon]
MSSNARWRGVKIVEPVKPSKYLELVGGLKNAFERGESFIKAKQSFINAGYQPSEVEAAARELRKSISPTTPQAVTPAETKKSILDIGKSKTKQLPVTPGVHSTKKKSISKILIVFLIIISILIFVGVAILGLFWDKWF